MKNASVHNIKPLDFQWETSNPFLFCVHHHDFYPKGNEQLGPDSSLKGRNLGMDFSVKDGWRMYHGETIPGFPEHPHRGFETVTVVLEGFVDHSDSHGAAGRYGNGDVQWMTAGRGMQHCEMFPLLNREKENTLELFQIWLNLPEARKFCEPHYKMLWAEDIPVASYVDEAGKKTETVIIAGEIDGINAVNPAPDSWAADKENEVAIWIIKMERQASWTLPVASPHTKRTIFFYKGSGISVDGTKIEKSHSAQLAPDQKLTVENTDEEACILLLQAKPINEPVVQHGPFVMNTEAEIREAFTDYQKTRFGGWPWPRPDNVHDRDAGRFALYSDGKKETP